MILLRVTSQILRKHTSIQSRYTIGGLRKTIMIRPIAIANNDNLRSVILWKGFGPLWCLHHPSPTTLWHGPKTCLLKNPTDSRQQMPYSHSIVTGHYSYASRIPWHHSPIHRIKSPIDPIQARCKAMQRFSRILHAIILQLAPTYPIPQHQTSEPIRTLY